MVDLTKRLLGGVELRVGFSVSLCCLRSLYRRWRLIESLGLESVINQVEFIENTASGVRAIA